MTKSSTIVVVEDDFADQFIMQKSFDHLNLEKEIIFFETASLAYDYLMSTSDHPFLIISDINLPGIDGLDFRKRIQENAYLRKKAIPFVFFTTSASRKTVSDAFDLTVQGFFTKSSTMDELAVQLKIILDYWNCCAHPNRVLV